ncbi:unnamed protein product [Didymodactylos carnosus]|nr:unnamed protein product [Didymodactylos carnosus]CAF3847708.1 unnamed protein product [Didymodactylos carnosus]
MATGIHHAPNSDNQDDERRFADCDSKLLQESIDIQGLFHLEKTLKIGTVILMGGPWSIDNISWNSSNCNLKTRPPAVCQKPYSIDDDKRTCFGNNMAQITNYSQQVLQRNNIKLLLPDVKMNLLPYPKSFNVTVIDVKPVSQCDGHNPVACHVLMDKNDCTFIFCHLVSDTHLLQITVKYESPAAVEPLFLVNMTMLCHSELHKYYKQNNPLLKQMLLSTKVGDVMCHFVSAVSSFFICKN